MSISDWSTSQTANQTADAEINWQEGQLPSTVNNSARAMMATLAAWRNDMGGAITAGGTADAITVTLEKPMTSAAYSFFSFIASATNTGAATLKVDSQSALPLRSVSGASLSAGQIRTGRIYHVIKGSSEWLVSNAGQANSDAAYMAAGTVKANLTGASAAPTDSTVQNLASAIFAYGFPTGTKMLFVQTSAPTGWTKDTTHNNKALRIVSGTAGTGGTVDFTAAFASQTVAGTVGNTTLDITQIPAHTHTLSAFVSSSLRGDSSPLTSFSGAAPGTAQTTSSVGSGASHTHSFTGTAIDLAVKYVDVVVATKD